MSSLILPFAAALAAAGVLTPLARLVAIRLGYVAQPREDRWHKRTTALFGGVAIAASTLVGAAAFIPLSTIWPMVAAGAAMFCLGVVDDIRSLKPSTKLIVEIAIASFFVYAGDSRLHWTTSLSLDAILTMLWIVGITNAFNLLDNMDGLSAGVALIAGTALLVSAQAGSGGQSELTYLALLLGAISAFLIYNFNPASIFLGDSGSLFIGLTIAALTIDVGESAGTQSILSIVAGPLFVLLIPILDTTLVTISRIWHGRRPSVGGRDHSSHRLVAIGLSERAAVGVLWTLAGLGGGMAAVIRHGTADSAAPLAVLFLVAIVLFAAYLSRVKVYDDADPSILHSGRVTRLLVDFVYKRRVAEIILDLCLVSTAYYGAHRLRFEGEEWTRQFPYLLQSLPVVVGVQMIALYAVGAYHGVWRYFSLIDGVIFAKGVAAGVFTAIAALVYLDNFESYSRAVFLMYASVLLLLLIGSRASFRLISEFVRRRSSAGLRLIVYGAGDNGAAAARQLVIPVDAQYRMVGFVDDNPAMHEGRILGYDILGGFETLTKLIENKQVDAVVISARIIAAARLSQLQHLCASHGISLFRFHVELHRLVDGVTRPDAADNGVQQVTTAR